MAGGFFVQKVHWKVTALEGRQSLVLACQERAVQAKKNHNDPAVQERLYLYPRLSRKEMAWVDLLSSKEAFLGTEQLTIDLHMCSSSALRCDLAFEAPAHQLTSSRRRCSKSSARSGRRTCSAGRRVLAS